MRPIQKKHKTAPRPRYLDVWTPSREGRGYITAVTAIICLVVAWGIAATVRNVMGW